MAPEVETANQEEMDLSAVEKVREQVRDIIDKRYDTKWNILRWLQSNNFNIPKTVHMLRKHLKWRKERRLDEPESESLLQFSEARRKYMPMEIIGEQRVENGDRLIVVDQAGRIDVGGLLKSVQPTEYLHEMYRNFEQVQRRLMKMEEKVDRQCSMYYIFDLDGLQFDPTLLSVVNGPFRVSWQLVGLNYREFIDKFIVINAPSYINVLWSALCPFIPEQSRHRIIFTGNNWKEELGMICDPQCLPVRYGGTIADETCLKEVLAVPKEVYWKPKEHHPSIDCLHKITIPASKHRTLIYKIDKPETLILMYSHNEDDMTITLYYSKEKNTADNDLELMVASIPKCGLPAMDLFDYMCEEPGYYYLRLTNEASWLLPSSYKLIIIDNETKKEIEPINMKEKWVKKANKKLK